MVASVIGKFTNTSAHTSYLFFVKEHFQRLPFATAPAQKSRGSTLSVRRAGRFSFRISTRCRAGPPLYIDSWNTVNVQLKNIRKYFQRALHPANGQAGRRAHYRGWVRDVKNYLPLCCPAAPCALEIRSSRRCRMRSSSRSAQPPGDTRCARLAAASGCSAASSRLLASR